MTIGTENTETAVVGLDSKIATVYGAETPQTNSSEVDAENEDFIYTKGI